MANHFKFKIILTALLAIIITDFTQIYVSNEFERPILYRFKVIFVKIGANLARFGEFLNFGNDVFIFRNYLNFGSNVANLLTDDSVTKEDKMFDGINVRIYRPLSNLENKKQSLKPFLIYFHGGYYIFGNLNSYDMYLIELSKRTNLIILSVDYKLAPENPFPGPLSDCIKVTEFILDNSKSMDLDVRKYVLAGDSAGGHAAAVISQYLVKINKPKPSIQLLIYPWTQMYSFTHPSFTFYHKKDFIANSKYPIGKYMLWLIGIKDNISEEMENIFITNNHTMLLNDKILRKKYDSYLDINLIPKKYIIGKSYYEALNRNRKAYSIYPTSKLDDSNILLKNKELANKIKNELLAEEFNPGLASPDILKQLPKTYFIIVEWDSLKDQGIIYAERLKSSGVTVKIAFYDDAFHGIIPFIHKVGGYNVARAMFEDTVSYINLNL